MSNSKFYWYRGTTEDFPVFNLGEWTILEIEEDGETVYQTGSEVPYIKSDFHGEWVGPIIPPVGRRRRRKSFW